MALGSCLFEQGPGPGDEAAHNAAAAFQRASLVSQTLLLGRVRPGWLNDFLCIGLGLLLQPVGVLEHRGRHALCWRRTRGHHFASRGLDNAFARAAALIAHARSIGCISMRSRAREGRTAGIGPALPALRPWSSSEPPSPLRKHRQPIQCWTCDEGWARLGPGSKLCSSNQSGINMTRLSAQQHVYLDAMLRVVTPLDAFRANLQFAGSAHDTVHLRGPEASEPGQCCYVVGLSSVGTNAIGRDAAATRH